MSPYTRSIPIFSISGFWKGAPENLSLDRIGEQDANQTKTAKRVEKRGSNTIKPSKKGSEARYPF